MAFRHLHLTRKDMAMLSRVLAEAGFNSSPNAAEAARFLTRKLQEGMKDEAELASERWLIDQRRVIEEKYLPNAETWVACRMGEPVGFISLLDTFIGGIFVAPDQQGQGIGRKLIAHAMGRKGVLSLEVYTQNEQALRFYTALGFHEVSRRSTDDEGLPVRECASAIERLKKRPGSVIRCPALHYGRFGPA